MGAKVAELRQALDCNTLQLLKVTGRPHLHLWAAGTKVSLLDIHHPKEQLLQRDNTAWSQRVCQAAPSRRELGDKFRETTRRDGARHYKAMQPPLKH